MTTRHAIAGVVAALLVSLVPAVSAHHSLTVEFDITKTVTLSARSRR